MITTLHIKNIGIIDELEIDLNKGVNVLTGETGAGKSLIIDSLSIICGGRFQKELIRHGTEYSLIEACIYLPESEFAEDGNIIVSRQVYANGKNLCKINGRLVTVSELKDYMKNIIDIHEQNDNQKIMDETNHILYLDSFIGKNIEDIKSKYQELYVEYKNVKQELNKNYGDDKERERTLDLLSYELNEIENADLKDGEEEELEEKRKIFQNSQKIAENLNKVDELLSNRIIDDAESAIRFLSKISDYNSEYNNNLSILQDAYYNLQDVMLNISGLKESVEFDSENGKYVEERLDLIYNLKRKYGNNIPEILKYKEELELKINKIENLENHINSLKTKLANIKLQMFDLGAKMNDIRNEYKVKLEVEINENLKDLEMKNAKFMIENIVPEKVKFDNNGMSNVEFKISTNVGEDYKSMIKIASGGELSRIMLAIKTVLSKYDNTKVIVLDEIDSGISGKAARAVSEKIKMISKNAQVVCVTHLPVVAACADYNYYISKKVVEGNTKTSISLLEENDVIKEIARISTGEVTDISLKHAFELRKVACIA